MSAVSPLVVVGVDTQPGESDHAADEQAEQADEQPYGYAGHYWDEDGDDAARERVEAEVAVMVVMFAMRSAVVRSSVAVM